MYERAARPPVPTLSAGASAAVLVAWVGPRWRRRRRRRPGPAGRLTRRGRPPGGQHHLARPGGLLARIGRCTASLMAMARGAGLLAGRALRGGRWSLLGLALVVALGGGASIGAAVAAYRTDHAYGDYVRGRRRRRARRQPQPPHRGDGRGDPWLRRRRRRCTSTPCSSRPWSATEPTRSPTRRGGQCGCRSAARSTAATSTSTGPRSARAGCPPASGRSSSAPTTAPSWSGSSSGARRWATHIDDRVLLGRDLRRPEIDPDAVDRAAGRRGAPHLRLRACSPTRCSPRSCSRASRSS